MKRILLSLLMLVAAGCAHPEYIREDNALLIRENQAVYEFNLKLLDRLPATTEEQFAKKLALREIVNSAHHRADKALKLLADYLDSTEFVDDEDEAIIRNFAEFLAEEINRDQ